MGRPLLIMCEAADINISGRRLRGTLAPLRAERWGEVGPNRIPAAWAFRDRTLSFQISGLGNLARPNADRSNRRPHSARSSRAAHTALIVATGYDATPDSIQMP